MTKRLKQEYWIAWGVCLICAILSGINFVSLSGSSLYVDQFGAGVMTFLFTVSCFFVVYLPIEYRNTKFRRK